MEYLKIYNTLDSTNLEAQRLLAEGAAPNGLTLLALQQTHGKGQMGRAWIAEAGNHLSMTIIYRPAKMDPAELTTLGMKISLGIVEGLLFINPDLKPLIKWPNDIYIHDKKLCGILIENALAGNRVQHSIIGIGMNVNEETFPSYIPNAISLHLLTGEKYNVQEIALTIRHHVMAMFESSFPSWKVRYDQFIFGKDKHYTFLSGDQTFNASVIGISDEGHLRLLTDGGHLKLFASHEVRWVVS
jgi:BirA family transcriptional regulator, biotin operon repressor / biotin---[acetyl-CoA-carboxylase] ligase